MLLPLASDEIDWSTPLLCILSFDALSVVFDTKLQFVVAIELVNPLEPKNQNSRWLPAINGPSEIMSFQFLLGVRQDLARRNFPR